MARGIKKQLNREDIKSISKTIRVSPKEWNMIKKLMKAKRCTFSSLVMDLIKLDSHKHKID